MLAYYLFYVTLMSSLFIYTTKYLINDYKNDKEAIKKFIKED